MYYRILTQIMTVFFCSDKCFYVEYVQLKGEGEPIIIMSLLS
jgi:hypothetical protein